MKKTILILLTFIGIATNLKGLNNIGIDTTPLNSGNKKALSTDVFVVSNRVIINQNKTTTVLNKVKDSITFDYMTACGSSMDSLKINRTDSTDFITKMSSMEGNWLVFVHGDAKTLEQSIIRGLKIKELYDVNVLVFSWPSKDPSLSGVKNFKTSQSHVNESLGHFIQLLKFVQSFKEKGLANGKKQKVSLLFHSLGNLYMELMIKNNLQKGLPNNLFSNLILNAAAVNQEKHKNWVEKIKIQDKLYITSNKSDFNLKGLHIFTKNGKQLGEKITPVLASNANYIHFDKSVGFKFKTGRSHTYFIGKVPAENSTILDFYSTLFHGKQPNLKNSSKFKWRKDNLGYEIK